MKSSNTADINEFERELLDLIDRDQTIELVTIYGVLQLVAADILNKASMARVMLSEGKNNDY